MISNFLSFGGGVYLRARRVSGRGDDLARWETAARQTVDYLQAEPTAGSRYQHWAAISEIHGTTHR